MNDYRAYVYNDYNSIYHYGVKGMRWGVRRFQKKKYTKEERAKYDEERAKRKEAAYLKKKHKWTTNARDFEKHYDELTDEERKYAIKRHNDILEMKKRGNSGGKSKKGDNTDSISKHAKNIHNVRQLINDVITIGGAAMGGWAWLNNSKKGKRIKNTVSKMLIKIKNW